MEKVIVVIGPTSVGKTKMGIELAKRFNGEVISGDSMQIYRGMDIGTAKVTQEEMEGIVHHCIDIRDPKENYSIKDFQDHVRHHIHEMTQRGKFPIIVGGTGLYIKSALYDYTFEETQDDHQKIIEQFIDYDDQKLHDYLKEIDPQSAEVLHPHNRRRILRAIEIYQQTGKRKKFNKIVKKVLQFCTSCYTIRTTNKDSDVHRDNVKRRLVCVRNPIFPWQSI